MSLQPFHLAIPVDDLAAARAFYGGALGCPEGRSAERWVDFDLFGHQLVVHAVAGAGTAGESPVDGDQVPVPHFGVVLTVPDFHALAARLKAAAVPFGIEPRVRFRDQPGEQWTMFVRDPAGNALEFKAMADPTRLFAR
ncbi:MAG: VOC family protein [Sphingomonadaceae bacterium]|nr:VOC family protein [Sphingomonadaceae bacterium]